FLLCTHVVGSEQLPREIAQAFTTCHFAVSEKAVDRSHLVLPLVDHYRKAWRPPWRRRDSFLMAATGIGLTNLSKADMRSDRFKDSSVQTADLGQLAGPSKPFGGCAITSQYDGLRRPKIHPRDHGQLKSSGVVHIHLLTE